MVSPEPVERLEQELAVLWRRSRSLSAQLARDLHPELEAGAYGLLLRVGARGGVRATDLAGYLGIGKPTVSRQLAALERLGLVERTRDTADARAQVVVLTQLGRERVERVRAARQEHVQTMLGSWDDADVDQLAALLSRFNGVAEAAQRSQR